MATVNAAGELQLEQGDVLPREIAVRDDDPAPVRQLIEDLNPTIETAEDLQAAVEQVDAMRRELASRANQDNPHLTSADESEASKPQPNKLTSRTKGPAEK